MKKGTKNKMKQKKKKNQRPHIIHVIGHNNIIILALLNHMGQPHGLSSPFIFNYKQYLLVNHFFFICHITSSYYVLFGVLIFHLVFV